MPEKKATTRKATAHRKRGGGTKPPNHFAGHIERSGLDSIQRFLHCNLCRSILGITLQSLGATLLGEGLEKVLSDKGVVVAHRGDEDFHRLDEECKTQEVPVQ